MSKTEKKKSTGDYETGYCRPPTETRWRKGESGNPKGRKPKKQRRAVDVVQLLREQLGTMISARDGDKEVRLTLKELAVRTLTRDLLQSSPAHRFRVFKELRELGAMEPGPRDYEVGPDAIAQFVEKLAEEARRSEEMEKEFPRRP